MVLGDQGLGFNSLLFVGNVGSLKGSIPSLCDNIK